MNDLASQFANRSFKDSPETSLKIVEYLGGIDNIIQLCLIHANANLIDKTSLQNLLTIHPLTPTLSQPKSIEIVSSIDEKVITTPKQTIAGLNTLPTLNTVNTVNTVNYNQFNISLTPFSFSSFDTISDLIEQLFFIA